MTPTARDLVETGAIDMATYWHNSWETMAPEPKVMYLTASRAALIATFRKLAEDGPTEALQLVLDDMTDEACAGWRVVCRALLRELEDLTP